MVNMFQVGIKQQVCEFLYWGIEYPFKVFLEIHKAKIIDNITEHPLDTGSHTAHRRVKNLLQWS